MTSQTIPATLLHFPVQPFSQAEQQFVDAVLSVIDGHGEKHVRELCARILKRMRSRNARREKGHRTVLTFQRLCGHGGRRRVMDEEHLREHGAASLQRPLPDSAPKG
jgi:hypothetical protein